MGSRSSRFRRLERARRAAEPSPGAAAPLPQQARFRGLKGPEVSAESAEGAATHSRGRFTGAALQGTLELQERVEGAQPFTRCARCEVDNSVYVPACIHCGASLESPEQRAFNERLWRARQEYPSAEEAAERVEEVPAATEGEEKPGIEPWGGSCFRRCLGWLRWLVFGVTSRGGPRAG